MSEEKKELNPLNMLNQLKQQHASFCVQKEQALLNLNQLIGAIYACESIIKNYEVNHNPNIETFDNLDSDKKEKNNGEVKNENEE